MKTPKLHRYLLVARTMLTIFLFSLAVTTRAQKFDWLIQLTNNGTGNTALNKAEATAIDSLGNVYILGQYSGTVDFDPGAGVANLSSLAGSENLFLAKYDSKGGYLWARNIAAELDNCKFTLDAHNVYICGRAAVEKSYYYNSAGVDSFLDKAVVMIKYNNKGDYIWAEGIGNHSWAVFNNCQGGIAVDHDGKIYVSGSFADSFDFDPGPNVYMLKTSATRNQSLYLAKYNTDGSFGWVKEMPGKDTTVNRITPYDMIVDHTNGIYITGYTEEKTNFDPGSGVAQLGLNTNFLVKYDSSGRYLWVNPIGSNSGNGGHVLASDQKKNVYITGTLFKDVDFDPGPDTFLLKPIGSPDVFLAKYDSSGHFVWARQAGGLAATTVPLGIALSKSGAVYLCGYLMGTAAFDPCPNAKELLAGIMDVFIAQYDAAGNYQWAGSLDAGGAVAVSLANSVALDKDGNLLIAGTLEGGPIDFDPNDNKEQPRSATLDNPDIFLLKLDFNDTASLPPFTYLNVVTCSSTYSYNNTVYTKEGSYTHVFKIGNGCKDSTVVVNLTFTHITRPVININKQILGVTGDYATYQWMKNGVPIPGATSSDYVLEDNGAYQVIVTNSSGCTDTSEIYQVTNYTGIDGGQGPSAQIDIYPNPVVDIVYIQSPFRVDVVLTDASGRTMSQQKNAQKLSLKDFSSGIYFLSVRHEDGTLIKCLKLYKQ